MHCRMANWVRLVNWATRAAHPTLASFSKTVETVRPRSATPSSGRVKAHQLRLLSPCYEQLTQNVASRVLARAKISPLRRLASFRRLREPAKCRVHYGKNLGRAPARSSPQMGFVF